MKNILHLIVIPIVIFGCKDPEKGTVSKNVNSLSFLKTKTIFCNFAAW
ncbi:MAG TPA: hypothetical protein VIS27_12500 [Yeosuana sp.]